VIRFAARLAALLGFAAVLAVLAAPAAAAEVSAARSSLRVFVSGASESGKSQALHQLFVSRLPRVISLDINGEVAERSPQAERTFGYADLCEALKTCARKGAQLGHRWHIAAYLEQDEIPRLFRTLAPPINTENATSFTRAIGGIAIECGEASWLAPNNRTPPEVRDAFHRGRHHQLSLLMATQRPADVARCVTAEARVLIAFRHHETLELDWWAKRTSRAVADVIAELPQYHSIYYVPASGRVHVCDAAYRPLRVMDLRGNEVARAGPRLVRGA